MCRELKVEARALHNAPAHQEVLVGAPEHIAPVEQLIERGENVVGGAFHLRGDNVLFLIVVIGAHHLAQSLDLFLRRVARMQCFAVCIADKRRSVEHMLEAVAIAHVQFFRLQHPNCIVTALAHVLQLHVPAQGVLIEVLADVAGCDAGGSFENHHHGQIGEQWVGADIFEHAL